MQKRRSQAHLASLSRNFDNLATLTNQLRTSAVHVLVKNNAYFLSGLSLILGPAVTPGQGHVRTVVQKTSAISNCHYTFTALGREGMII